MSRASFGEGCPRRHRAALLPLGGRSVGIVRRQPELTSRTMDPQCCRKPRRRRFDVLGAMLRDYQALVANRLRTGFMARRTLRGEWAAPWRAERPQLARSCLLRVNREANDRRRLSERLRHPL